MTRQYYKDICRCILSLSLCIGGWFIPAEVVAQSQAPVITSVSPLSGPAGTKVTIEGQYFNPSAGLNTVRFGTVSAPVISASGTVLTVEVPAGAAAYGPVSVTNSAAGKTAVSAPFTLTFSHGIIFPDSYFTYDYTLGSGLYGGTLGDFNNDGFTDLATFTYHGVYIRLNNGSGGFTIAKPSLAIGWTDGITAADYNGDGNLDLIAANGASGVTLLPGKGDGTFGAKVNIPTGEAENVAAGDFNRDGHLDIVVASRRKDSVNLLINDGTGGFAHSGNFYIGRNATDIVVVDFDGDGNQDIAASNYLYQGPSVLFGNGSGGFLPRKSMGGGSQSVVYGDFNEDGRIDIAVRSTYDVVLYINEGGRAFSLFAIEEIVHEGRDIIAGDFNGDGHLDIASVNVNSDNVSLVPGDGRGGFLERQDFSLDDPSVDVFPRDLRAADVNNDGKTDIVTFNQNSSNVTILRYVDPKAIIEEVSGVTSGSIDLQCFALVNAYGLTVTERGVVWSTSPTPTIAGNSVAGGAGYGAFTVQIKDLAANTTYYARPYVINSEGTFYGNEVTVATMPSITTKEPTDINPGYAESGGVIDMGGEAMDVYYQGICWSKNPSPTIDDHMAEGDLTGPGEFTAVMTGLEPLTTYFVRAFIGTSAGDYVYGDVYEFTSPVFPLQKITDFTRVKQLKALDEAPVTPGTSALEGDLAIVPEGSKAVIYDRNAGGAGNWGQTATLSVDSLASWFLVNAAIDEDVAVLRYFDGTSHLYIFQPDESNEWEVTRHFTYDDTRFGDFDRGQLVLDKDKLVISTRYGSYIFYQDKGGVNNWGLVKEIPSNIPLALDLDEDKLVVSQLVGEVDNIVRVYYQNRGGADNWGEVTTLAAEGLVFSVAIHGGQIITGAPNAGGGPVGKAYVFEQDLGGADHWGLAATLSSGWAEDGYGTSVAMGRDVAMVGAYNRDSETDTSEGTVYVLAKNDAGKWVTSQKINEEGTVKLSQFGRAVALSGNTALFTSGSAYIYEDTDIVSLRLSSGEIPENKPEGTVIGAFSIGGSHTGPVNYALEAGDGGEDNARFYIDGNQLKSSETFDYESKVIYHIHVKATDGSIALQKSFTIRVTDVNEAPGDIFLPENTIPDGSPPGALVGTFSTDDPDQEENLLFALIAGAGSRDNSAFSLDGNALYLTETADFSEQPEYHIRIRATDKGGLTTEKSFVVSVIDLGTLSISLFPENAGFCTGGDQLMFHVDIQGAVGEPVIEWLLNKEPVPGETNDTLVLTAVTEGDLIQVKVTARDASDGQVKSLPSPEYPITLFDVPVATLSDYGFIITASEGSAYQWYYNSERIADSTRSIIARKQGSYRVAVFSENGCSAVSEPLHMFVTAVSDPVTKKDITVFPNPALHTITVSLAGKMRGGRTLTIYDLPGNIIYSRKIHHNDLVIDISEWASGYYILCIGSEGGLLRRKILKAN